MGRLESAVEWSIKHYGTLNVKWGEILRLKRGQTDLPLSGGPDIVRAIYSKKEKLFIQIISRIIILMIF